MRTRITIFALGAALAIAGLLMLMPGPVVLVIVGAVTCLAAAAPPRKNPEPFDGV